MNALHVRLTVALLVALLAVAALPADEPGRYVGFHGDGTGVYPEADPPTEWSATNNVLWKTPMPNWSNSQPVAAEGRVFVMSEPLDTAPLLVCLDDATGKELWRREVNHLDAETQKAFSTFYGACRKALQEKRDGKWTKYPRLSRELKAKGALVPAWTLGSNDGRKVELNSGYGWQYVGHAYPTPVTDGRYVWVWCFPGVAACYDRDGKQRWLQFFNPKEEGRAALARGCTFTSSPVIVDDTLIILGGNRIRGLDPATGQVRWDNRLLAPQEWEPATPKVVTAGQTQAVFCIDGGVYRVRDGKLLANIGKPIKTSTVAHADTIFFSARLKDGRVVTRAIRLAATGADAWKTEQLWEAEGLLSKDHDQLTPVYCQGKIYGSQGKVWDAATGQTERGGFDVRYSSPIVTGKYLIARQGQNGARRKPVTTDKHTGVSGESLVRVYDRETKKLIAVNALPGAPVEGAKQEQILKNSKYEFWMPRGYQTIFCAGDRLYIRTHDHLWCIGKK